MKRSTIIAALMAVCATADAASIGNVFGALMGRSSAMESESNLDQTLSQVSAQINRKTPIEVDSQTRLDRVSTEPGARLLYHYTLTGIRSGELNPDDFTTAIRPKLKERLCASREMQGFLKSGVKVSYLYQTVDGRPAGRVEFTPSDCGYKT